MIETLKNIQSAKTLRLILGDQLNESHSWFTQVDDDVLYVIAELPSEMNYVNHHIQKICAFFLAMEAFAKLLSSKGHRICWLTLDDTADFESLEALISKLVTLTSAEEFHYQLPDEYRLKFNLESIAQAINIPCLAYETEHFFLNFEEVNQNFKPGVHNRIESFYRKMRKQTGILMEGSKPVGGRWNYDSENRKKLNKDALKTVPKPQIFINDATAVLERLNRHQVETIGRAEEKLVWPIDLGESRELLSHFLENCLVHFGTYQDAMTEEIDHAWSLYHSRLSFALNAKIISPREVIYAALEFYYDNQSQITIAQIEGFVRQILGWREYVRGIYWVNMPNYVEQNYFSAERPLPSWFWSGETKMACMKASINQSLDYAYAHHIQRLMIVGNFSMLAGLSPSEVDEWYLGIYIDAIEWVELPNTRGMALFADGGWIATKPYAASGNYINKMSDHCKHCIYSVKTKTEQDSCPFNSLYWSFIGQHEHLFSQNPRMAFPIKHWKKLSPSEQVDIENKAIELLDTIEEI